MSAHVTQWLSAYLDGETAPAERARVEEHLRECPDCEGRLEQLAAVDAAARELPVEPPAGYLDSFSSRVRQRIEASRRPFRLPVWALPLAAGLIIAVAAPLALRHRGLAPPPATFDPVAGERADRAAGEGADQVPPASMAPEAPRPELEATSRKKETVSKQNPGALATTDAHNGAFAQAPVVIGGKRPSDEKPQEAAADGFVGAAPPPAVLRDGERQAEAKRAENRGRLEEAPLQAAKPTPPPPSVVTATGAVEKLEKDDRSQAKTLASPGAEEAAGAAFRRVPAGPPAPARPTTAPVTFEELRQSVVATLEEARAARARCRAFIRDHPDDPRRDEARVLAIEMGNLVYRFSGNPADREETLAEARTYLADKEARQRRRVEDIAGTLKKP
jgi:putative zinc finger protein